MAEDRDLSLQAILLAGDRGYSRSVRGRSKAFLGVAGKPMVVHVLETLLHTAEVSEIFVVGDPVQLERVVAKHGCLRLGAARGCPIHIVPQRASLYENVWHGFLRTLPPGEAPEDHPVLVVPADVPLLVPEEVSDFVCKATALEMDYVLGLTPEHALHAYAPCEGAPGMEMALFNLREGRFRQNNLHFVRPLRIGNRRYLQDMYETRYQTELGNALRLAWRGITREFLNLWLLFFYAVLHLAGVLDRRGHRLAADRIRRWIPLATAERGVGRLLRTRFCTVQTEFGGAALDVDNDADLLTVEKMFGQWKARQVRLARAA